MARNKNKGFIDRVSDIRSQIHPDTEKTILAVVCIVIAAILILALFHKSGPAGEALYRLLTILFGLGYYLFPLIFLIMAGTFISGKTQDNRRVAVTLSGATLFVLSGLGVIDIIAENRGGLVGRWMGSVESPFGYIAGLIITAAIMIISLLVTINLPFTLRRDDADEEDEEEEEETEIEIENEEQFEEEEKPAKTNNKKQNKEEETEDEEEELQVTVPGFAPVKKKSLGVILNYTPPPLSLLKSTVEKPTSGDLRANANIIKRTLESFGIPVEMGEISIGPKVTRYTLKPAEGIKLARLTALNQDLSLALAAHPIRIEAPIPGKSLVGIEVPNKSAAVVRLGSLMSYPEFANSGPLGFILGRDVSGEPIFGDIAKMPHLLVAGATGSGKSVAIHSIIMSLLFKNGPATLKMIMIDPKRVELTLYNDIPHLISPVITDGKKSLGVFRWAIAEMENRYEKLQAVGARDIKSYNKYKPSEALPYLLIIVDELADLMATYGRDIESSIVRLAQMARATGIHLVLSTQRPSVEVITGLIKANITSRMALQVASQIDSRTILDTAGAEKLLGGGDMLFMTAELSKPKRIQGAYITEEELHEVADFIRDNNKVPENASEETPNFSGDAAKDNGQPNFESFAKGDDGGDELYDEAVSIVRQAQKASASLLQRRLSVGYARAARLLDLMEDRGVVGPGDGAKPREVYVDQEDPNIKEN